MKCNKRVAILQHRLLHYRIPLFRQLRDRCQESGIDLCLVHGQPSAREAIRKDTGHLEWAYEVRNRYMPFGKVDLIWQPFPSNLRSCDLIVLMQENRILSNYPLLFKRRLGGPKLAYWGHGRNFQSRNLVGFRERWKSSLINQVDWWFAYTDLSQEIVEASGFLPARITVLNNAIDNDGFRQDLSSIQESELNGLRARLGLQKGSPLGLFCGSMYAEKRLEFLIEAADQIHRELPEFRLALIGDGPDAKHIEKLIKNRPWAHWLGPQRGREKATAFRLATVILNPGLVGLHVLDGFCAGLAMFTTRDAPHSPEIAYLRQGETGFTLPTDSILYARAVLGFLQSPDTQNAFKIKCLMASETYTLNHMVERFHQGIVDCLQL